MYPLGDEVLEVDEALEVLRATARHLGTRVEVMPPLEELDLEEGDNVIYVAPDVPLREQVWKLMRMFAEIIDVQTFGGGGSEMQRYLVERTAAVLATQQLEWPANPDETIDSFDGKLASLRRSIDLRIIVVAWKLEIAVRAGRR